MQCILNILLQNYRKVYKKKKWGYDYEDIYLKYGYSIINPILHDIFYDNYADSIRNPEDVVFLLYHACQMAVCANTTLQTFCSLFTQHSDALIFYNFLEDYNVYTFIIQSYFGRGSSPEPIIYSHSCFLLKDIIEGIDNKIESNENDIIADFKFGHAETIAPLYGLLNLFNSTGVLNISSVNDKRSWRGSSILPMAGHINFELYECDNKYKLRVQVNEEDVILPIKKCNKSSYIYK